MPADGRSRADTDQAPEMRKKVHHKSYHGNISIDPLKMTTWPPALLGAQHLIAEAAHEMSATASIAGSIAHERKRLQQA